MHYVLLFSWMLAVSSGASPVAASFAVPFDTEQGCEVAAANYAAKLKARATQPIVALWSCEPANIIIDLPSRKPSSKPTKKLHLKLPVH